MFEIIIYLIVVIIGGGMLLTGIISFLYGLYGLSVPGFDKAVRNFSLGLGISLIALVTSIYISYSTSENNEEIKLVGKYSLTNNPDLKIELKSDGSFEASPELFVKTHGKWKLIDFDEFYLIEILTEDNRRLKSLDIIEIGDRIKLMTDNDFTNVEDQMELIRM